MPKSRFFGMLIACLAIGAMAAAPFPLTTTTGVQEQEEKQEEKKEEKQEEKEKEKEKEGEQEGEQEGDDKEKKYETKEVMKIAHKDGLLKKIATGKASDDDKKQLVVLYKAMAKNKPPKGEEDSWKELNKLLVEAAEAAVKGEEDFADRLLKASNCKACHDLHK